MTKSVAMLFPTDPEAVVLSRSHGLAGSYVIWKMPSCRFHFHFSYSVCGLKEEDSQFLYPSPAMLEDEALKLCIEQLGVSIERQTKEQSDGSLKH